MSQVDLQLFGYPEIRVDGRLTSLPLRKAMAALTYVVEAQTTVSRDALATLLWPDADEATAHARLRRLLHRMQEHLGVGIIAAGRTSLCATPGIQLRVDSQAFEQACQQGDFENASRLYRADFLGSFSADGCPDFDEWAFFRREALRSRFFAATAPDRVQGLILWGTLAKGSRTDDYPFALTRPQYEAWLRLVT